MSSFDNSGKDNTHKSPPPNAYPTRPIARLLAQEIVLEEMESAVGGGELVSIQPGGEFTKEKCSGDVCSDGKFD